MTGHQPNKRTEYERVGGICHYCQIVMTLPTTPKPRKPTDASWDHIVPKAAGGDNRRENKLLCCKRCNEHKGSMSYEEAWLYRPWELSKSSFALLRRQLHIAKTGNIAAMKTTGLMCPLCQGDP